MKTAAILFTAVIVAVCAHGAQRFAAPNGAHIPPFDSWAKAATNIQSAVNAAADGDVVMLSNGLYRIATHILVTNGVTLRGLNGAPATIIAGTYPASSNRCMYLAHPQAVLDGVTVSNGAAFNEDEEEDDEFAFGNGGGVYCIGGKVLNCVVASCQALIAGAGIYARDTLVSNCLVTGNYLDAQNDNHYGAGICCGDNYDYDVDYVTNTSLIVDCDIRYNAATNSDGNTYVGIGGGVFLTFGSRLANSIILGNAAGIGGGVTAGEGGSIANSRIVGNAAGSMGGGVFVYAFFALQETNLVITHSVISNNVAGTDDGGGILVDSGTLACQNCLIAANTAAGWGGGVLSYGAGVIENCTITKNRAESVAGMDAGELTVFNTIIYSNISDDVTSEDNDYYYYANEAQFSHCCVHPDLPEDSLAEGFGDNIAQDPQFVDYAAGDFRLAGSSPCINSGTNLPWMTGATDLAGAQRVQNTFVDIGAYEQVPTGTIIRISRVVLDFGDVAVGDEAQKTLAVANPGLGVLSGYAALPEGDVFGTAGASNYSLPTFQSALLTFTFSPTNEDEYSSTAELLSSPSAKVHLRGYGVPEPAAVLVLLGTLTACRAVLKARYHYAHTG